MRILSLNVWGGALHEQLLDYLRDVQADVICLQEVIRSTDRQSRTVIYRDVGLELPQRTSLFEEIGQALPDHNGFYFPTSRGALEGGHEMILAEFGIATFVRKSLAIIGQSLGFVHGSFSPDGWGDHPRPRNAHCIRLFDYVAGAPLTIAHMHGLRTTDGKGDTPERRNQAHAFAGLIRQVWQPGERLVACGDFNILPDSETFAVLEELGLIDLVTSRGHTDTRTSHYKKQPRFADYMLVSSGVSVEAFNVVEQPEVSDHRALLLALG